MGKKKPALGGLWLVVCVLASPCDVGHIANLNDDAANPAMTGLRHAVLMADKKCCGEDVAKRSTPAICVCDRHGAPLSLV